LKPLTVELPSWIAPGDAATLVWYSGRGESADGMLLYQVAGPALDMPPASPYFLLAPVERGDFAGLLYRGQVGLLELRGFLQHCTLARGEMSPSLDRVAAGVETPVLPVLDAWRGAVARPLLSYLDDIGAFLPGGAVVRPPEAYVAARPGARAVRDGFRDECGEAAPQPSDGPAGPACACASSSRTTGVWSCRLHPRVPLRPPIRSTLPRRSAAAGAPRHSRG
jgi:hypothetical protein